MRLQNDLSRTKTRVAELQPTLEHIEEIKAETALLQPKISTLRTARADTLRWRALLQIVSQSIPSNAWLSGIAATTPSATGTPDPNADPSAAAPPAVIAISGTAGSQTLVGETMSRLGSYPVFGQVDLRFTQIDAATGGAASADGVKSTPARVKFEIGAQLKSSAPGPELSEEKQASVPDDSAPAVFLPAERQASATTTTADSTRIRRREKEIHPNG
jgi:Tfp pilus assembly protein PilN